MIEARDHARVCAIAEELRTVRIDRAFDMKAVLRSMHEVLELESVGAYMVRNLTGRWEVSHWEGTGVIAEAGPMARAMFASYSAFPLYYNPLCPPKGQRNRAVDALAWIHRENPGEWERNEMANRVLGPLRAASWNQPRVLLVKDGVSLGWFGGLHPKPPTRRQLRLLTLLAAPFRDRLHAELRLADSIHERAALEAMLEHVGVPAYVVDARGRVQHASTSGRHALSASPDVSARLKRAVDAGRTGDRLELVPIADSHGGRHGWIALVPAAPSAAQRIEQCVTACARRWGLTRRQAQVLEHLVHGLPNATIATLLGCVERTVELHVTAIFDRAGIDSRSALVARVLTADC